MSTVITIENLWKEYRLGVIGHGTLTRDLQSWWARVRGKDDPNSPIAPMMAGQEKQIEGDHFWALRNINFQVRLGEVVGIIGDNGAGKSTLLKILSRVTAPTQGTIKVKGRVASLLEVGTGFHPELTGRENIFMNGAILGMSKPEITRKLDEIIAFSGIENFIETPVKRYSSGMYVRLAFAVAAHLDPEILIIDEVLAVGDIEFQKKCVDKMKAVSVSGRTVLVVSHNMATMANLSDRIVLLENGTVSQEGSPKEIISQYEHEDLGEMFGRTDLTLTSVEHYGEGQARFQSIYFSQFDQNGNNIPVPQVGCDLCFRIHVKAFELIAGAGVALTIYDENENRLVDANTMIKGKMVKFLAGGAKEVIILCKNVLLKPDVYIVGLWMGTINQKDIDGVRYATSFKIEARNEDVLYTQPFPGTYMCDFEIDEA